MKKNIVVCCEGMDQARIDKYIRMEDGEEPYAVLMLHNTYSGNLQRSAFQFCPWCGKKLPFPYEETE
jgi:hypothetical protein